jgi:riboflavin synthase
MFTGLVEETGTILRAEGRADEAVRFEVAAERVLDGLAQGDSVAVDGVCLTAVRVGAASFEVQAIGTTLQRTTLGRRAAGDAVNLERAMKLGARLGGHLVQGHVDAVGTVAGVRHEEGHVLIDVTVPGIVAEATVLHGSIAIDGVSLTVNAFDGRVVQVALIPHTWQHTTLRRLAPGEEVNLEADLLGKYVAQYMKRTGVRGV